MKNKIKIITLTICTLISLFNTSKFTNNMHKEKEVISAECEAEAVIEVASGRLLYSLNSDVKKPMASTTKILTAICVIENCDIEEKVKIKQEYTGIEGSSIYLKTDEVLSVKELLYGLMLRSGNDAAVTLACHVCGSIEKFSDLMNETAKKCGATNSNFVNPHGLHDDNHYTTAYDLAKISAYAMRNQTFREIVSTKNITVGEGENIRYFKNKNKLLFSHDYITGVKTGYTKKAGRCLVAGGKKDGLDIVAVVLNCSPMFERCEELINNACDEFNMTEIIALNGINKKIPVKQSDVLCEVYAEKSYCYPLKEGEEEKITVKIELPEVMEIPFDENEEVGKIEIYLENQLIFCGKLYTIIGVKERRFKYVLKDVIYGWSI